METEMKPTILAAALLAAGASETVNFDKADAGKAPSGWTATQTGSGQAHCCLLYTSPSPRDS